MLKGISLLLAGSLIGAGTMYLFVGADRSSSQSGAGRSLLATVADAALGRPETVETISVSESLAVYRSVADESDPVAIQQELAVVASEAWSVARDVRIDALLARLSELAPTRAAQVVRALGLDEHFVADAFVNWASVDPAAALAELNAFGNAVTKREVALALLEVFGDDNAGFDRVTAGMPNAERESLRVEWLGRRTGVDPVGAFRDAQAIYDSDLKRRALLKVAAVWAEQDPLSALSQADLLPDIVQSVYRASIFNEWARLDGAGFLAWLESVDAPPDEAASGIRLVAASNPERLFNLVDGKTGSQWRNTQTNMMYALAEINPEAAMARVATWPLGSERDNALMLIGTALARSAPDEALAWAEQLTPPSPNVLRQIAMSVAQSDPSRALEFIDNPPQGIDPELIASLAVSSISREPGQAEDLANKLIARDSIRVRNALRNLIGNWMQQDPERALEWILVHDDQVNAGVLGTAAQSMARSDAVAAAGYVDRIPAEYRSAWIAQVAVPYALSDPAAALSWVARFQGQDVYDDALRGVITGSAQIDPRRAAELLAGASAEVQLGSARQVAQIWAQKEPRAAARWAADEADEGIRETAVDTAVSVWASNDPSAATSFTLDLERGEMRDKALNSLIARSASAGDFDRSLLDAMSTDQARQTALSRAIPVLARNDPEQAQDLLNEVTSANARRQIEEQIAEIEARR